MTSSTGRGGSKINQRLLAAPAGAVLTLAWLKSRGISGKLANYYASSGWLHRVGEGAFTVRPGPPGWLGAIFGLQQKECSVHPGGRTALELAGQAHFLPLGDQAPVYLFDRPNERLPQWFKGMPWASRVQRVCTNFLPQELCMRQYDAGGFSVQVSEPERAILEFLLQLSPDEAGYEHARLLFEGLGTLRPSMVQSLLERCTSVKVKRLFLHLAARQCHPWFQQLDLAKISLGSGKRVFVPGGRLDPDYLITVPIAAKMPADAP